MEAWYTGEMLGKYHIKCGDSREFMGSLPDAKVDAVLTDPPFVGFGFTPENYFDFLEPFLSEMQRCVGKNGSIAISQPPSRLNQLSEMLGAKLVIRIPDAFSDSRGEDAYFVAANPVVGREVVASNWKGLPGTSHPNPRDVNKMAALVKLMSNPGDTILDPFCGSGAIGLAAVLLQRNFIGVELLEDRAIDARRRFESLGWHVD